MKSSKQGKTEAYTERLIQSKKLQESFKSDHTKSEPSMDENNKGPLEVTLRDISSKEDILISQPLENSSSSSSENSFDADYIKENFIISSNDLYGIPDDYEEEPESRIIQSHIKLMKVGTTETAETRNESKNDFMPLIRLLSIDPKEGRVVSSTGGHN